MNNQALVKQKWKEARPLRLSLGYCHPTEEKIIQSIFGVAAENEDDALVLAKMIQKEELKEFTLWGISLVRSSATFQSSAEEGRLLSDMRQNLSYLLLMLLQTEALVGYGYVLPRNIEDGPFPIPEDVWFGDVDWENSAVTGGGLSFASVRIAPQSEAEEGNIFEVVSNATAAPGRPTKKHLIVKAFEYGVEQGQVDTSESNARIYQKVRDIIKHLFPEEYEDGKGLQDGAMQKHLAALIESKRLK